MTRASRASAPDVAFAYYMDCSAFVFALMRVYLHGVMDSLWKNLPDDDGYGLVQKLLRSLQGRNRTEQKAIEKEWEALKQARMDWEI